MSDREDKTFIGTWVRPLDKAMLRAAAASRQVALAQLIRDAVATEAKRELLGRLTETNQEGQNGEAA
jgi:hypothetical protein